MLRLDWNLLFTIIDLLVLYLLMKRFLFGPLNSIMEKRKEVIEQKLSNAEEVQRQALELKNQYEGSLHSAQHETLELLEMAKERAGKEYERIVGKANVEAGKIIENAQGAADLKRKKTLSELESEIAGLAMAAAAKIVGEQCSDEINQSLYDQFIVKAGEKNDTISS